MSNDESLRARIEQVHAQHCSEFQQRHNEQLELLDKVAMQLKMTRSLLINSHEAELNELRDMKRLVGWMFDVDERQATDGSETNKSAAPGE